MTPYLRAANVTWNGLDLEDVKEMNFEPAEAEAFELQPGDILLNEASGSSNEVGKPAIWRGEIPGCCFQNTLLRVRTRGPLTEYLYWYFRLAAIEGRFGEAGRGVNIRHLGKAGLVAFAVPLAPRGEQDIVVSRIEELVSRLDAGVEQVEAVARRVERLRSTAFSLCDQPHWPQFEWGDVGKSQNGRAFSSKEYSSEGIRLLRPGNLHASGTLQWTTQNTRHLPSRYAQEFPNYVIGPAEIVMNLTAQSLRDEFLGRVCLTGEDERCLLNQRIARLTPIVDLEPKFVLYHLKSRRFRRFVDSLNTGSLIQHMFTRQLAEYRMPIPSRDEQIESVRAVDRQLSILDSTALVMREAISRSDGLRRSILRSAFHGRLVARGPADNPLSSVAKNESPREMVTR
jgi:type I restriction enzyme S subunit